jgi:hypothetical protein
VSDFVKSLFAGLGLGLVLWLAVIGLVSYVDPAPPQKPIVHVITRTIVRYRPLESVLFVADKVCAKAGGVSGIAWFKYAPDEPELQCLSSTAWYNPDGSVIIPALPIR